MATILVTGVAGFIGMHVAERFLADGHVVVGVDDLNDYYAVSLKSARLERLRTMGLQDFHHSNIADTAACDRVFDAARPDVVVHLAAQAGVRHSMLYPHQYVDSNVRGTLNVLEGARRVGAKRVLYASSSSVYGATKQIPFVESQRTDRPLNVYAASKQATELLAQTYAYLYRLSVVGMRFFTVYGPWGRPDMAYFHFAQRLWAGEPIELYDAGAMQRDFTNIRDVVRAVAALLQAPLPFEDPEAPHLLVNVGRGSPVSTRQLVTLLAHHLDREPVIVERPAPQGEIAVTFACTERLVECTGVRPEVSLDEGIAEFAEWFRHYHASSGA
jgi:UDP-glucuronate 4-epimerase